MFKNLLIADSGKGHVEEMVRMLRDLPAFQTARVNLLHVVSEQSKDDSDQHWTTAGSLLAKAVDNLGLNPGDVNSIIRQGDAKQTVLKVADELDGRLPGQEMKQKLQDAINETKELCQGYFDAVQKEKEEKYL